ncbi:MAG: CbiX/SirB N-terminal domain-containing protein [Gammaproteobacteria bacterium]
MHALLIVAHGSRKQDSNQEIKELTLKVASQTNRFELVECAFLELAEPDIVQAGSELVKAGTTELTVLPYFLVEGRHVATDVPDDIEKIQTLNPDLKITLLPYFGASERIVEELVTQISS